MRAPSSTRSIPTIAIAVMAAHGLPSMAWAQGSGENTPPKRQKIEAVERGLYLEGDAGINIMLTKVDDRSMGPGAVVGFHLGYDITPVFALSLGAQAIASSGTTEGRGPRGDLVWFAPTLTAQFAVLTSERNFLWLRAYAGFGFGLPGEVDGREFGGNGPVFGGTVVFERFTKVRHFSIGAQAGVNVVTKPSVGIGLSLVPIIKYTF